MIQMIVDVLIVVILKEMIYLPKSYAEPSNCSEYRYQSDVPDPQPEPLPPTQFLLHHLDSLHWVRLWDGVMRRLVDGVNSQTVAPLRMPPLNHHRVASLLNVD